MLHFEPVDGFSSQNPYIRMVCGGFEIPDLPGIEELMLFNIRTFSAFTTRRREYDPESGDIGTGPEVAYDPVNHFLRSFTVEEHEKIAYAFLESHLLIRNGADDASDIEEVEDKVGDILDRLDREINLCKRTETYVKDCIPVAKMDDAGSRPQDTPEMTFHHDEAVLVTAIAVFMKLISPIMGAFIFKYSKVIDNEYKESHARAILTKLHSRTYQQLLLKLHRYLTKLVSGYHKGDATAMYNGNTLARAARHAVDTAVVKRLVCVSLHKEDGNIIKYLACCGTGAADSQQKNIAANNAAKIITDPVDQEKDEGNTSRMEAESRQSAKTADTPIIISVVANNVWKKVARDEEIDPEMLESARAYYRRNPVIIHDISLYLLSMYYGPMIGGGSGISMLNAAVVSDMAATFQFILASSGSATLAHILTANLTETPRESQPSDLIFNNAWQNAFEYTECKKLLPAGFGEKEWNAKLKNIASTLVQRTMTYNTAPAVWEMIGTEGKNGVAIHDFQKIMIDLMKFVSFTYVKGKIE
jgi:hypothetical protein